MPIRTRVLRLLALLCPIAGVACLAAIAVPKFLDAV